MNWRNVFPGRSVSRRVLDVGSGHRPHREATHCVDRYPRDDTQRARALKVGRRRFIAADAEALPFKPGVFDYVYARHVIEHTERPDRACDECSRVAAAGFIESPSPFYEQGYGYPKAERGWPYHKWYVWKDRDGILVFRRKTAQSLYDFGDGRHGVFVRSLYERVNLNRLHRFLPHKVNYTCFEWEGRIEYRLID